MRSTRLLQLIVISWLFISSINQVYANLLITPTRVQFSDRDRSAKVSLINTSKETKTYKIYWRQQAQLEDGQYSQFKKGEREFPTADQMLRYSPRQVTLKPGERQHIRLALRRPKDLLDGEYRSHLVFDAQPNKETLASKPNEGGIKLHLNLSFAIPIIVRAGTNDVSSTITDIDLVTIENKGTTQTGAFINIERQGNFSTFGKVLVYWKDSPNQPERLIGIKNNVAIFRELPMKRLRFGFKDHSVMSGIMRVVYEGSKEYKGQVFSQKTIKVNALNYRPAETYK